MALRGRNVMRRLLVALMLVSPVASAQPAAKKPAKQSRKVVVERVVAVVNDAIILSSELDARLMPVRQEANQIADAKERERRLAKLTSQVLDDMINEELIVQAAQAAKIEVDADEVKAALNEIKTQNKLDDQQLAQALLAQGYTVAGYKAELRRQILRLRAVNTLVSPKVVVTDEDVRAKYDQLARRSESVSAVALSHILVAIPENATEQQIAEARTKAAGAIERVQGGEKFEDVAAALSDDESTKATGGVIGWFERGSMQNPDWEAVVFSMEKGDVRGPITGPMGLHVFLATDIKKSNLKPYEEMKDQLSKDIRRRGMDKQTQVWLEELRKKAYIDIKL